MSSKLSEISRSIGAVLADPVIVLIKTVADRAAPADPAHDACHSLRVLASALRISDVEGGDPLVLAASALLHDIANLPKNHPDSRMSSEMSAKEARKILTDVSFPLNQIPLVEDAILCHSYSRGLTPQTLEGRIFQDADRLDGIGAIGIARTFTVGGSTARALYFPEDPFLKSGRTPDDRTFTLDHFYSKLLKIGDKMLTPTGRILAAERTRVMQDFLKALESEL